MNATLLEPPPSRAPASLGEALLTDVPHADPRAETPPPDERPARTTPNLGLPVPGDGGPADGPGDIGALADALDLLVSRFFAPGLIIPSARPDVPGGWLQCTGQPVSRTVYAALFAAIGVAYGPGDGSTTFTLPQLSDGRFPCGSTTRAGSGGEANHQLTAPEMPSHAHGVYDPGHAHALNDPGHAHLPYEGLEWADDPSVGFMHWQISGAGSGLFAAVGSPPYRFFLTAPRTRGAGTGMGVFGAGTGISLYGAGSDGAHNNMPPYQTFIFLIKT